jgi:hypothetical protein
VWRRKKGSKKASDFENNYTEKIYVRDMGRKSSALEKLNLI